MSLPAAPLAAALLRTGAAHLPPRGGFGPRRAARAIEGWGGTAPLLLVGVAVSTQLGSAIATTLFSSVGPIGALGLRTAMAAVLVVAVGGPRVWRLPAARNRLTLLALCVALTAMNICYFEAIARIPLGLASTIDFLGPLSVALLGSRGRIELLCVALAAAGVALLGKPGLGVDGTGLVFALGSAASWAAYILLAKRAVSHSDPLAVLAVAFTLSTVALLPAAIAVAGHALWNASVLGTGLGVAILASGLPYVLELVALRRVRAATFGVLLSLEPGVAALIGLAVLGQRLHPLEVVAVACVVVASAVASRRETAAPPR